MFGSHGRRIIFRGDRHPQPNTWLLMPRAHEPAMLRYAEMTNTELLVNLRNGDEQALHELLVRHLDWIRSYVHKKLTGIARRHADTGDIVQEVMVRALKHGPQFVVESDDLFRGLMGRIVINTITSVARHEGAEGRSPQRERAAPTDSVLYLDGDKPVRAVTLPPDRAAKSEERDWIDLGLRLLDPADRAVLTRRDWHGKSFVDIAAELEIQEDAARMRYKRAVKKLAGIVTRIRAGELQAVLGRLDESDQR